MKTRIQAPLPPSGVDPESNVSLTQSAGLSPSQGISGSLHFIALRQVILHFPRNPLKPAHPEDSTEHAQKQRQLQEDQDLEVDAAEQGPVGM